MKRLLLIALGVTGSLAVALAPHARRAVQEREIRAERKAYDDYIAAKERELDCLERLTASGLPKGMDVQAELDRCRAIALDAEAALSEAQGN